LFVAFFCVYNLLKISKKKEKSFHGDFCISNFDDDIFKTEGIEIEFEEPSFYGYSDTDIVLRKLKFDKSKIKNSLVLKYLVSEWDFEVDHSH